MSDEAEIVVPSATWRKVTGWAEAELKAARDINETPGHEDGEYHLARGKIVVLKKLLDLATPPAVVEQIQEETEADLL